jgi:hypothetical protein
VLTFDVNDNLTATPALIGNTANTINRRNLK